MRKTCPFCKSDIDYYAVICPACTRDTRDLQSVFGDPPTLEQRFQSLQAGVQPDGCFGILKVVGVVIVAILLGFPSLPFLLIGAVIIGLALFAMYWVKQIEGPKIGDQ